MAQSNNNASTGTGSRDPSSTPSGGSVPAPEVQHRQNSEPAMITLRKDTSNNEVADMGDEAEPLPPGLPHAVSVGDERPYKHSYSEAMRRNRRKMSLYRKQHGSLRYFVEALQVEDDELEMEHLTKLQKIAKSWQFELCVWGVIVLNCIAVWIETSFSHRDQTVNKWPWIGIQFACLFLFVAEIIFKIVVLGRRFFKDVYSWIDLGILFMTILPWAISMWLPGLGWTSNAEMAWRKLSILRIIRALRISRALRYHTVFREFWMLTSGITYSLKTLVWGVIITAIMLFVFGTFATTMIGFSSDFQPEEDPSSNQIAEQCRNLTNNLTEADAAELQDRFGIVIPLLQQQCEAFVEKGSSRRSLMGLDGLWPSPRLLSDEDGEPLITEEEKEEVQLRFGTVVTSMRTLFQIMTLDDWTDATEVVIKQQAWMWLFFVGFICISVFALTNLITAVLVESATQMSREDEKRREFENHREIRKLRRMLIRVMNAGVRPDSPNGSGDRLNERTDMAQRGTIGSLTTAAEEEEAKASMSDPKDPSPTHARTNGMAGGAPSPKGVRGMFFKSLTSLVDRSGNTPKGKRRMSRSDVYQDVQLSEMNDSFTKTRLAQVMEKAELKRLMKMYECEPNDLLGLCDQLTVDFETRDPTGRRKEGEIKMDDFIFGVQRLKGGAKSKDLLQVLTRLSMIERNQEHIMKVLNALWQAQVARAGTSTCNMFDPLHTTHRSPTSSTNRNNSRSNFNLSASNSRLPDTTDERKLAELREMVTRDANYGKDDSPETGRSYSFPTKPGGGGSGNRTQSDLDDPDTSVERSGNKSAGKKSGGGSSPSRRLTMGSSIRGIFGGRGDKKGATGDKTRRFYLYWRKRGAGNRSRRGGEHDTDDEATGVVLTGGGKGPDERDLEKGSLSPPARVDPTELPLLTASSMYEENGLPPPPPPPSPPKGGLPDENLDEEPEPWTGIIQPVQLTESVPGDDDSPRVDGLESGVTYDVGKKLVSLTGLATLPENEEARPAVREDVRHRGSRGMSTSTAAAEGSNGQLQQPQEARRGPQPSLLAEPSHAAPFLSSVLDPKLTNAVSVYFKSEEYHEDQDSNSSRAPSDRPAGLQLPTPSISGDPNAFNTPSGAVNVTFARLPTDELTPSPTEGGEGRAARPKQRHATFTTQESDQRLRPAHK